MHQTSNPHPVPPAPRPKNHRSPKPPFFKGVEPTLPVFGCGKKARAPATLGSQLTADLQPDAQCRAVRQGAMHSVLESGLLGGDPHVYITQEGAVPTLSK